MGDPIARVQNPFPTNIAEFVRNLPHKEMTNDEFRIYMNNCKWGGNAFFRTYYQLACQVGLYYIDEKSIYHPRFIRDISDEEATEYLKKWFSKYYVPNPYTRGFDLLEKPVVVEYSIYEYLKEEKNDNSIGKVCEEVFKEKIGNPDILINTINRYSSLIKVQDNKCYIREGADKVYTMNSRDDKKAFFETFNDASGSSNGILLSEIVDKGYNRIIFGAPGTGKSFLLNEDTKAFIDDAKKLTEDEIIKEEIFQAGNNRSKYFAIGLKYHCQFEGKKPKEVSQWLDCSVNAAYFIVQGSKAFALLRYVKKYDDSSFSESCIRVEYEKLVENRKSMNQACAALVGYMYADLIEEKSGNEFNDILGLNHTSSIGFWITYGIQAADYKYEALETGMYKRFERVTFHPDYSYAQFVGTYKPVKSQQEDSSISYDYVPGPFIRVLVNALKNPKKPFLLLIEEINRANAAAVFGDAFQLLDRNSEGSSLYPIEASEDLKNYLSSVGIESSTLAIPSNMFIWATMNSADQGVFPMDTAFKRRWNFEYIGINDNEEDMKDSVVVLGTGDQAHKIRWNDLRHAINDFLSQQGINEDKQLGPYFIGRNVVVPQEGEEIDSSLFISTFKNKVLMYLFEDAARQKRSTLFSGVDRKNSYSSICEAFDSKGMYIFNENIFSNVEKLN